MIGAAVYVLCALTSATCAVLLWSKYRSTKLRLLFWSSLCFIGLTLNNVLLFVDLVVVPEIDLSVPRSLPALIGVGLMVWGFVWESES